MWTQISLIIVLTFHLHACHHHTHSIHIANPEQGGKHGYDVTEVKLTRVKRRDSVGPEAGDLGGDPDSLTDRSSGVLDPSRERSLNDTDTDWEGADPGATGDGRPISAVSRLAIQDLFDKYGNGLAIDFDGFQRLMASLGLGGSSPDLNESRDQADLHEHHELHDHVESRGQYKERLIRRTGARLADIESGEGRTRQTDNKPRRSSGTNNKRTPNKNRNKKEGKTKKNHRNQKTEDKTRQQIPRPGDRIREHSVNKRSLSHTEPSLDKCMTAEEVMLLFVDQRTEPNNFSLSPANFVQLCPILVHQLDGHLCPTNHSCQPDGSSSLPHDHIHDHGHDDHDDDHHHDDHHEHHHGESSDDGNTTLALSVGLFTASAKVWGYAFLSCLIISVVGLASVAIVPIMHQVFYNHLLQYLVALAIGSLTGDAFLHLLPHAIVPHDHGSHDYSSDNGHSESEDEQTRMAIWLGCVALGGIYFFLLAERIMGIVTRKRREQNRKKRKLRTSPTRPFNEEQDTHIGAKLSSHNDDMKSCEQTLMVVHPNKGVCGMAVEAHEEVHQNCDPGVRDTWGPGQSHDSHGPGHHHSHEVPGSVASVAWMVIVGDGLHNFSDGLAIGAAFANGLTSGLSTSIAVFCHELPHELGDFAVLLRAGMSVKQALVYNCVSSILCLVGMITGIAVGNLEAASQWIFALISGMFIYIALVDMLPEISNISPKEGESPGIHLVLQSAGIMTGAVIMLLIAIYEDKIQVPHWEP